MPAQQASAGFVDPRGQRFAAAVTTVVLAIVVITGSGWLLVAQALVFALGAFVGLRYSPYSMLFRYLVRPRLGPPAEMEAEQPVRFAQSLGLLFAVLGGIGYLSGLTPLGVVATAFAIVAAFLNAAFEFCLGCETYLLIIRFSNRKGAIA
jgi:hypothetical protein